MIFINQLDKIDILYNSTQEQNVQDTSSYQVNV